MADKVVSEYEWRGPRRGVDRAVLLAHGAGSDMHATSLVAVADALANAGIPSLRFNYPYRTAGKGAPDRPKILHAATREAAAELAKRVKLPPERIVLGGRSMGGRYCSLIVGDPEDPVPALGLLMLGYPLHAAGKPDQQRAEHFPRLRVPVLFVSGTRDSLAGKDELTQAARAIKPRARFHWLETADHGFRPLKASGLTTGDVNADVAAASTSWVSGLKTD
ncbi:MAG: alpha/beta family hydrolase [Acidimicrobiia bacterium]